MSSKAVNPVTILLVEDDIGHATLIQMNLEESGLSNPLHHVDNGQKAMDFVYGTGSYADQGEQLPLLILLDLNLPVLNGYQVLERLKNDKRTRKIPIVILTTTEDRREIERCYELGCNVYLNKPVEYDAFQNAIRQLGLFLSVIQVPDTD